MTLQKNAMLFVICVQPIALRVFYSINTLSVKSFTWGKKSCNSPLQTPVRQPASQQAATAVFQLPGAPGMQREPRRAAVQACVREQRALSVPRKQPGGDFHPIDPLLLRLVDPAWACGGSPEMGLCMAAQKGPFVMKYYVVLSPTVPEHPSVPPQGRARKHTVRWRGEKKKETELR